MARTLEILPRRLGPYTLIARLGSGAMGRVYHARDRRGRAVAVKLLAPHLAAEPEALRRFAREVEVLTRLRDARIVRALSGLVQDNGESWFSMELVAGSDLGQVLLAGPLEVGLAAGLVREAALGLAAAHAAGVIHRDVKPTNLLLPKTGGVKVADFGLAFACDLSRNTLTGTVLGTPHYMAPELAEGKDACPASDVYGLGCVLFEALTGFVPFSAPRPLLTLRWHCERAPRDVRELRPDCPTGLAALVARCLAKAPAERPDAADLAAALAPFATGARAPEPAAPGAETEDTRWPTAATVVAAPRPKRLRHGLLLAVLGLELLAVCLLL